MFSGWTDNTPFFSFKSLASSAVNLAAKPAATCQYEWTRCMLVRTFFGKWQEWLVPAIHFFGVQGDSAFRFFNKNNISVQNICSSSMCVCDATWIGRYVIWALKVSLLEFSIVLKANLRMRRQAKFVGVFLFF